MSGQAPAGWYPPDPNRSGELRYWDGSQWTDQTAGHWAESQGQGDADRIPGWLASWPAIIVGFLLCLVPGVVLLWLRPSTSHRVKGGITAAVVGLLAIGMVSAEPADPDVDAAAVVVPEASESPSALVVPEASQSPSAARTPTSSAASSPTAPEAAPSATASTEKPAAKGSAIEAVEALPVKGRAPKTGYDRDEFGSGWIDVDRNGCDTRNDMLKVELYDRVMANSCKVLAGTLDDPYTRTTIRFDYGGPSQVDVDHIVALGDAWQKGATPWPFAKRVAFANDPLNLQPTDASANRQKGDGDAATWLPPNKSHRCDYVARQAAVKTKYKLWVTQAEKDAMLRVLNTCPGQNLPPPGPQPTKASNIGGQTPPSSAQPTPKPSSRSTSPVKTDPRFDTCGDANDAGYGPYYRGDDPEYDWYQDRDRDGIVCEQ